VSRHTPLAGSHWWPIQNSTVDDKDSAQLSEYCFSVCETLELAIRGKSADDLSESVRMALKEIERYVDYP